MHPGRGNAGMIPGLQARALMLQRSISMGDRELVDRPGFDIWCKYALNVPMEHEGFDPSLLTVCQKRLLESNKCGGGRSNRKLNTLETSQQRI